jgi:hypothetical protein
MPGDPDGHHVHRLPVAGQDHQAGDRCSGGRDPRRQLAAHAVPGDEHPRRIHFRLRAQ